MKWPWQKRCEPSQELQDLHDRMRSAEQDDVRLRDLERRKQRLLKENHLGADIARALGAGP